MTMVNQKHVSGQFPVLLFPCEAPLVTPIVWFSRGWHIQHGIPQWLPA